MAEEDLIKKIAIITIQPFAETLLQNLNVSLKIVSTSIVKVQRWWITLHKIKELHPTSISIGMRILKIKKKNINHDQVSQIKIRIFD